MFNKQGVQSSEVKDQSDPIPQSILMYESGPCLDNIAESTRTQMITDTSEMSQNEQDVSKAFLQLCVPKPKEKRTVKWLSDTLPKVISGWKALEILSQRQEKKKSEEAAKLKWKEEVLMKKQLKEAELARKRIQREEKKAMKSSKARNAKPKLSKQTKRKAWKFWFWIQHSYIKKMM